MHKLIPTDLYKKILTVMPVPCVDMVIVWRGKFLLGKRLNKPAKGQWFLLGGRIFKGETFKQTIARKAKEEAGLRVRVKRFLGSGETMFPDSAFSVSSHTVNFVYLVEPFSSVRLRTDTQHVRLQWFSHIDPRWHPYVRAMLREAGFK